MSCGWHNQFGLKIFPSTLKQYFEDKGRYIACFCGLQNIHPPPAARFVTGNHPSVIYAVCHFASSDFNNTNRCGFFCSLTSDFSNLPSPNIANFESFASLAMEQLKNDYHAPSSFVVAPVLVGYGGEFVVLNSGMRQVETLNAYRCSHGHESFHKQDIPELAPLSSALSGIRSHARANARVYAQEQEIFLIHMQLLQQETSILARLSQGFSVTPTEYNLIGLECHCRLVFMSRTCLERHRQRCNFFDLTDDEVVTPVKLRQFQEIDADICADIGSLRDKQQKAQRRLATYEAGAGIDRKACLFG
ncbi:uncharacterized protein C8R40DRAFT_1066980 [Lentinula edodes]|uniref:uncharacterized protein n=1 Tax=Lentinula edodes TaxID=5353 RepID=UPI001E8DA2B7|nr:uncharacterized protein C8R40DRAFT_1066980 [Lentinula edodes]KAH7878541.1 hypothetical protein C8R40DRAFT_1066980 [Lentinula edodes]